MKTLHKTIKKQWFDRIASGIKKHEYLEIKEYWIKRLLIDVEVKNPAIDYNGLSYLLSNNPSEVSFGYNEFDIVSCRNGYSKTSPLVIWEHEGIIIGEGNPEWGAEPGKKYFILQIGEILELNREAL